MANAKGVIFGVFNDAAVAAEAHKQGEGAIFNASFNSQEHHEFSLPFDCEAKVVKLSDGKYVGRRGVLKDVSSNMGPSALLDLGGLQVVVITLRCAWSCIRISRSSIRSGPPPTSCAITAT